MSEKPGAKRVRIGEMLIAAGVLTQADLQRALDAQKSTGRRLGAVLIELGLVNEIQLTQMLSNQLSVPWVSLYHVEFSREMLNLLPAELADRYCAIPVYVRQVRGQGSALFVAMDDPSNSEGLEAFQKAAQLPVRAMVAAPSEIRNAIRVYYFGGRAPEGEAETAPAPAQLAQPVQAPPAPPASGSKAAKPPSAPAAAPAPPAAPPARGERPPTATPAAPATRPVAAEAAAVAPAKKARMISLTLLDGTTVSLPARRKAKPEEPAAVVPEALTAKDLVAALDAAAAGADVSDVLAERKWEAMFATLLSILRKGLIADWEFVEEWSRRRR